MNEHKLLTRLRAAMKERDTAHKKYKDQVQAVQEIETEILTGQPARPLLDAVEEREAPARNRGTISAGLFGADRPTRSWRPARSWSSSTWPRSSGRRTRRRPSPPTRSWPGWRSR